MDKAAVVGVGQTRYEREKNKDFPQVVYEAVRNALDDAGMELNDIDNVVTTTNDFFDGRTIACMGVAEAAGSYGRDATNVEGDGTFSAMYGLMRTIGGTYDTTLITAHCKMSEGNPRKLLNQAFDPIYERMLGIDDIGSAGLQARAYMNRFGITDIPLAMVAVKNRNNGSNNPLVPTMAHISVEDVLNSPILASPIKLLDASTFADGACAIILANQTKANKWAKKPVWIKGVGHCTDVYRLGERDLTYSYALAQAANRAYQMAGINDPIKEVDVAEITESFSYQELMWYEALGFCRPGEGAKLIEGGKTEMAGELPVNPSGGALSANPVQVTGLARIAEAVLQLRGEAGRRQVSGAKIALAHGAHGICGQSQCVWILSNEDS
jgi:acetyl-CoA C-acetyltransferase